MNSGGVKRRERVHGALPPAGNVQNIVLAVRLGLIELR